MQDRNFDDIAEKFSRNIYGTTKGQLRQAILWQDLEPLLAQLGPGPLRVLDAISPLRWWLAPARRPPIKV